MTAFSSQSMLFILTASPLLAAACGDVPADLRHCFEESHEPSCGPWISDVPEGGDIRIELQKDASTGTVTAATHAYFFKDQTPARRDIDDPRGEDVLGRGCMDMRAGVYFDNGAPSAAVELAATRTYLDVGASLTLDNPNLTIQLGKQKDRMDLSSLLVHDSVYLPASTDGTNYPRHQAFHPMWTEAGTLGAMDLNDGAGGGPGSAQAVQGVSVDSQLFVPADMTNVDPSFAAGLLVPAFGDWRITYDLEAPPADAPPLEHFLRFYNTATGGADFQCVGEANGTVTVPRAVLEQVADTGYIYFGSFAHVGHLQSGRRLDFVGVNSQFAEYTKL